MEQKRAEMKMSKSALKPYKSRSVSTQRQIKYHARKQATTDFMVNVDLAYVHRADEIDPYSKHEKVGEADSKNFMKSKSAEKFMKRPAIMVETIRI